MGISPTTKIQKWTAAAGQAGKPQPVLDRVVIAGNFLEKTARMTEAAACSCLSGIDFSKEVAVVRLPQAVYVQYGLQHKGAWFTHTGLSPDLVGLAKGRRLRKLYVPVGIVHALRSTARAIKDTWTPDRLFESISPNARHKFGQMTRGGGTQYLVHDRFAMLEL